MDYGYYADDAFIRLVRHFDQIVGILTQNLLELRDQGFDMNNGYMFGFSFGGQLVTEAGRRIGNQQISNIDSKYDRRQGGHHRIYLIFRIPCVLG